ncbi:MAG TPA: hypothetical protein VNX29_05440 [Kaistia sp.]|nr:hypothetical protein [Kaistia sp.]
MTDERLRLIAEMRDRLSPQLRRLKTVMESTGRVDAFKKLAKDMTAAERAGYRFGFMMGRTIRYGAIAAAGGAVVAGAAFVKFGKDAADALDENAALAKQIGISGDALRTLQGVATRYNVTQEGLASGLTKFNVNFGRLKQNQGAFYTYLSKTNPALAAQFKQVGSTGDAFLLLSDAISKTADPAKRAALIKAAGLPQEFLRFFADGPDDLRQTIKEVIKLQGLLGPGAFSEAARYGDAMDNIGLAWKGLRDELASAALPVVNPLLEGLANFVADNRDDIVSGFKVIATDVGAGLQSVGAAFASIDKKQWMDFWTDVKGTASALAALASGINSVVQSFGGWKVVIGSILALKAAGFAKNLIGGVLPDSATSAAAGAAGGAAAGAVKNGLPGLVALTVAGLEKLAPLFRTGGPLALVLGLGAAGEAFHPTTPQNFPYRWNTAPGFDVGAEERARRWEREFRSDPEGTRGRMRVQLGRRADVDAAAKTLADVDATIKTLREHGADKTMAKDFADLVAQRNAMAARIEEERAADIGKKIGGEAAKSFFDGVRSWFRTMSYQGGAGGGGARVWSASYQPSGGGTGMGGPRANGVGGSYAGKGMLDLIAAAEGTGNNYNETLGYGRFTGGKVNLTGMTLDQIDALQTRMLQHPGNSFNSSAVGRYQFTRTRLRDLRKRFNLPGSAVYNKAMQDALARASLAERGGSIGSLRNEWEGLRRVPDNALRDAMQRHNRRKREERQKVEGSASVDIRFPNGVPPGTKVGAQGKGLFREVNLDTGRSMKEAMA